MSSTVPGNKLQHRLLRFQNEDLAPAPGGRNIALGIVKQIFLPSTMNEIMKDPSLSQQYKRLISKYQKTPGRVYAQVSLMNNQQDIYLPFKGDLTDYIERYSSRISSTDVENSSGTGDRFISSTRLVRIEFQNNDFESGDIEPAVNFDREGVSILDMVDVLNIGGIFGV